MGEFFFEFSSAMQGFVVLFIAKKLYTRGQKPGREVNRPLGAEDVKRRGVKI